MKLAFKSLIGNCNGIESHHQLLTKKLKVGFLKFAVVREMFLIGFWAK